MATNVGSGLGGSVGFSAETVYGTYVAPTRFREVNTAPMNRKPTFVQGGGLAAGRFLKPATRYVQTNVSVDGSFDTEVSSNGFGLFLNTFLGNSTIAQQGAGPAWLQTHTLADTRGKSLTMQVGVPSTNGTVYPYTYTGCKLTELDLACGTGELLIATLNVDGQAYSETQTLAAPSYTAGQRPFNFGDMNFRLGTFGSEAAVTGVRKVQMKLARGLNVAEFYANAGGKKAEPTLNAFDAFTGTIDIDFVTKADFLDRVVQTGTTSLVWEFVGPVIASTYFQTFRVTLSAVEFDTGDAQLTGPDVVQPSIAFTALDDGTNPPIKVEYISTDLAY